jgi:Na+(H+)/acetate symporter ActP
MHWIDWIIVCCIPLIVVLGIGLKSQKYIKGVSDFLTAGRYVVCVANGEATMGLVITRQCTNPALPTVSETLLLLL